MAAETLPPNALDLGKTVLLTTDSLGMAVEGAFWLYTAKDEEWRYFLVTSLVDRIGSREIYLRLNEVLAKKFPEAELFTFFICSPSEKLVREMRRTHKTGPEASEPEVFKPNLRGAHAYIYRLSSGLKEDDAKRVQRVFRRRANEFATA